MAFQFTVNNDWNVLINNMIINDEGGWALTNNANDPGGLTYGGMTFTTFANEMEKRYGEKPSREGFILSAKDQSPLLTSRIVQLYFDVFAVPLCLSDFPRPDVYLSAAVNLGTDHAGFFLQQVANFYGAKLTVDGIIGAGSRRVLLDVFNQCGIEAPRRKFIELWRRQYIDLVQGNCEAWATYVNQLEEVGKSGDVNDVQECIIHNKPKFKRWKYLEGWMNRVQRYV